MQNSTNMRILELLRFLYTRTDENHPATVSDIIAHLDVKGIQAVRQTVYADTNTLIDAGIDIVVVKSTQNQYFMGSRLFEYPELKNADRRSSFLKDYFFQEIRGAGAEIMLFSQHTSGRAASKICCFIQPCQTA